ncbi:CPBP family intramembrane metalloprotease [Chryseobacterium wangxinyae]|uniref:CPBP family intramembrane glutamic endopeptidase n=1 Tax=Chryseobacterium sp. CY350 TaxID=2997336 RepID=UPI00226EED3E|nr:CPBP family intramembrane glutamic endopeptidase [Chryseobacterium sp. CY350]MCY0978882.1 CPBP family intramembrane metalloprotease [Chryseobacterium sp. CY350]WBZ93741.1 CPBP family intramembrane metalloprotease [Chryseobacterium sp. CY350]
MTVKVPSLPYKFKTFHAIIFWIILTVPFLEEFVFRLVLRYNSVFAGKINRQKWDQYFPYLVYITSISFGLVHVSNYYNDSAIFYALLPLILLSQLSGGFVLSYIRVRINFYYGFIYHALWNFTAVIIIPAIFLLFSGSIEEHTKSYNLRIEEQILFHQNQTQKFSNDIRDNKIYKIEAEQFYLQDILDMVYGKNQFYVEEYLININFSSKGGVTKDEFKEILEKEYALK